MTRCFVVAPVYNEAPDLPDLLESWESLALSRPGDDFHFLLVDDGSQDGSGELATRLARVPLTVLRLEVRSGPGAAFSAAFHHLIDGGLEAGDFVATIEGDSTNSSQSLTVMLDRLQREGQDLALGSPYACGGGFEATTRTRVLLSHLANGLTKLVLGIRGIHTLSSFFRVYRGRALLRLHQRYGSRMIESSGFECMVEVLVKALDSGLVITEVPTTVQSGRRVGRSKMRIVRTILAYLRLLATAESWRRPQAR